MAKVRFSHLDDFVLKDDGNVGIQTSLPSAKVEVAGTVRAANIKSSSGITTVVSLDGYANQDMEYSDSITIDSGDSGTLSGEIVIGAGLTMTVGTGVTSGQGRINSLKVSNTFNPPIGSSDERPSAPKPGALFYNKDFRTIEYWDGSFWRQVDNIKTSGRTVFAGGGSPMEYPSRVPYLSGKMMDYVQIASQGNAIEFGELTEFIRHSAGASNHIRGLIYHGTAGPGNDNIIDKITIASSGNAVEFGLIDGTDRYESSGAATSTRCIFAGGSGPTDDIDYVEIMTDGNSQSFGDLTSAKAAGRCFNDSVRVVYCGGASLTTMETFIMASKGNGKHWGELGTIRNSHIAMSNSTRGIIGSGYGPAPAYPTQFTTESSTIASGGNTVNFGEIFVGRYNASGASQTRGLIAGGSKPGSVFLNTIEYVTISNEGNGIDFGDLTRPCYGVTGLSDCHGGLGGY